MQVTTPYGIFNVTRKGTVAITVVKIKRYITRHNKPLSKGDYSFIEHRKLPPNILGTEYWCEKVATYNLDGKLLEFTTRSKDIYNTSYSPCNTQIIDLLCGIIKKSPKTNKLYSDMLIAVDAIQRVVKIRESVTYGEYMLLRSYTEEILPDNKSRNWLIDQLSKVYSEVRDWPEWMRSGL